jgi:hypothetical protein
MSDELLRHLALNAGKLSKTKHFDPTLNTERERLEGATWLRLLGVLCYHANQKERQVWCGIARLAKEAGCNTDSTYRYLELLEHLTWITPRPARRGDSHHKPAKCWEITLPDLEPLEKFQARLEQQEREREESSGEHTPVRTPVHTPQKLGNGSSSSAESNAAREHKHKHKNTPARKNHLTVVPTHAAEEKSLLEQTLDCAASKAVNVIGNLDAWKAKLIGNAYTAKPQGSELTFAERAQRVLDMGKQPLDIGRWLADGCPANGGMTFWSNRPDFTEKTSQEAISAEKTAQSETDLSDIERHLGKQFRAKGAENE